MLKVPVTAEDHIQGDPKAPLVLVEYGDYECPHCGHAHPVVKQVQKHLGKQLAFVFRNFPLNQVHPNAEPAAETAEFAGIHKRFWEMHDAIYNNQDQLGLAFLIELAETLDLPESELETALNNGEFTERVEKDFLGGVKSGVNGTPTFFINGKRHNGSFEFDDLIAALESQLA
jgi:protein-disulfide isomerase